MPVPNTFANATATIPLSQLDANFATTITLGNTAIQLGNTVSTLNNMTLANVTISSGNVTITNVTVTTANVTTANIATAQIANVTVSGTGTFAAGSNTAPSITTSGDTNTGIFFPAADTIAFTEGGVESMRITSAGDVGIGTSTPATISNRTVLSINNASNGGALNLLVNGTETLRLLTDNSSFGYVYNIANQPLLFGTNNTERMRIDTSGNLGLGVTPSAWSASQSVLQFGTTGRIAFSSIANSISSNAYNNSGWKYVGTGNALLYAQDTGSHIWYNSASGTAGNAITFTQAMTLDASGNLGINTTSPGSLLSIGSSAIYGGGTANESLVNITGAAPSNDTSRGQITLADTRAYNASPLFIATFAGKYNTAANYTFMSGIGGGKENTTDGNYAGYLGLYSRPNGGNLTERARITSGGYFKATSTGTYSGAATSTVHEFDTSIVDGTIVNFYNQAASLPYGIYVQFTAADPNDATRYVFGAQQNTGVFIYRIYSNGTVAARSDVKWKKNIETARDGYAEDLAKLRVVKYNWYNHDDGTPKELGLIAQEVEQVFPGLVTTDEQTRNEIKTREIPAVLDEEGNEVEPARTEEYTEKVGTGEYSKSIKFSVLPIMLLKAVQEQQAMIQELKAEIAALKGNA